jgi:hypothetical protein
MLTYFCVENYKCLEKVDFPLTPIHVLIGPNDSGKTSVLEAMLTYMRSTGSPTPVAQALPAGWKERELVFHGAKGDSAYILLMANGEQSRATKTSTIPPSFIVGYGFTFDFEGAACRVGQQWLQLRSLNERAEQASMISPPDHPQYTTPAFRAMHHHQHPEQAFGLPRGFLGPVSLYRFDPKVLALAAPPSVERKFRMESDGFGLATILDDIIGYDPELFLQLRRSLCQFFPHFTAVRVETSEAYDRRYTTDGLQNVSAKVAGKEIYFTTQWGKSVRAGQASEGVLLFLAFLALAHLPPPHRPKLLLVEDVERGVYPQKLQELIALLKQWVSASASDDMPQIVLTTHSPYVLTFFSPEEVTFLSRGPSGGVRARPLRRAPRIQERLSEGFYLGELWYNLTEKDLFGDGQS